MSRAISARPFIWRSKVLQLSSFSTIESRKPSICSLALVLPMLFSRSLSAISPCEIGSYFSCLKRGSGTSERYFISRSRTGAKYSAMVSRVSIRATRPPNGRTRQAICTAVTQVPSPSPSAAGIGSHSAASRKAAKPWQWPNSLSSSIMRQYRSLPLPGPPNGRAKAFLVSVS